MSSDLELIRSRNPIADVVGEKFTLKKTGSRFIGVEHDSLVVTPNTGCSELRNSAAGMATINRQGGAYRFHAARQTILVGGYQSVGKVARGH